MPVIKTVQNNEEVHHISLLWSFSRITQVNVLQSGSGLSWLNKTQTKWDRSCNSEDKPFTQIMYVLYACIFPGSLLFADFILLL